MERRFIRGAPQKHVLWNREHDAGIVPQRETYFIEDRLVVSNVFEHIESTDHVEVLPEGDAPRVHLHQIQPAAQPRRCKLQPRDMNIAAVQYRIGESLADGAHDESRPYPDLHDAFGFGKKPAQRPDNQVVSGLEPEAIVLQRKQKIEMLRVVVAIVEGQLRREPEKVAFYVRRVFTDGAGPLFAGEDTVACQTSFHVRCSCSPTANQSGFRTNP